MTAFILAGSSVCHLGYVDRVSNERRALHLAEASVYRAFAELQADETYGQDGENFTLKLPGIPDGAGGELTFVQGDKPYSTLNLDSETATRGYDGAVVPPNSVHLVGVGTCKNATRTVELLVHRPPFPYVLASAGPVVSERGLVVGAIDPDQGLVVEESELQPGHLASNSGDTNAIQLGPDSLIVGDVRSVGGLELAQNAEVRGEQRLFNDPVALPNIDLTQFDPSTDPEVPSYQTVGPSLSGQRLIGDNRSNGDLTVVGDLELNGGTLYVDGNLDVFGGIAGKGRVVVTGDVRVSGGATLSSNNQSVLLAGGDVDLNGAGQESSSFQGLVYTKGSFTAEDITIIGVFVAAGDDSTTTLKATRMIENQKYTELASEPQNTQGFTFGIQIESLDGVLKSGFKDLSKANELAYKKRGFNLARYEDTFDILVQAERCQSNRITYSIQNPSSGEWLSDIRSKQQVFDYLKQFAIEYASTNIDREFVVNESGDWDLSSKSFGGDEAATMMADLSRFTNEARSAGGSVSGASSRSFDFDRFLTERGSLEVLLWRQR